jgi:hypothetical protein
VSETLVDAKTLHLLTPTPIKLDGQPMYNKEYVPVQKSSFSAIEVKLVTDLADLTPYHSAAHVMLVLHFNPRYKRKKQIEDNDNIKKLRDV